MRKTRGMRVTWGVRGVESSSESNEDCWERRFVSEDEVSCKGGSLVSDGVKGGDVLHQG